MESVTLSLPEAYDLALEVLSANGFSADHAAAIARNVTARSATAALPTACGGCWALSIPCAKVRYRPMPSRRSMTRRGGLRGRTPGRFFTAGLRARAAAAAGEGAPQWHCGAGN